jgi:glycosyltransferase involved in cell wall biosynthesis
MSIVGPLPAQRPPETGPLLTIGIPTFNRCDKALRQLQVILTQRGDFQDDIEVIVSDNASTDGTWAELYALPAVPGLRLHRNIKNAGLVGNLRTLISLAAGRYVWLIGDDDLLLPGSTAEVVAALRREDHPLGCLFLDHYAVDQAGTVVMERALPLGVDRQHMDLIDVFSFSGTTMMFITACVYHRETLRSVIMNDRSDPVRLTAPLHWSFACGAHGQTRFLDRFCIENRWGETSWSGSREHVFRSLVPRELDACRPAYGYWRVTRVKWRYLWSVIRGLMIDRGRSILKRMSKAITWTNP